MDRAALPALVYVEGHGRFAERMRMIIESLNDLDAYQRKVLETFDR